MKNEVPPRLLKDLAEEDIQDILDTISQQSSTSKDKFDYVEEAQQGLSPVASAEPSTSITSDNKIVFVQYDPKIKKVGGDKTLMSRGDTFAKKKTLYDEFKCRFDFR
ncbi:hypothetical protein AKO1_007604 [Acrasis kona]|uniref:Uncharacterized protein n=1 Tax=Acrasis kona TaxID=1008807 RepID=A0AAW2YSX3_9EUKA